MTSSSVSLYIADIVAQVTYSESEYVENEMQTLCVY